MCVTCGIEILHSTAYGWHFLEAIGEVDDKCLRASTA